MFKEIIRFFSPLIINSIFIEDEYIKVSFQQYGENAGNLVIEKSGRFQYLISGGLHMYKGAGEKSLALEIIGQYVCFYFNGSRKSGLKVKSTRNDIDLLISALVNFGYRENDDMILSIHT